MFVLYIAGRGARIYTFADLEAVYFLAGAGPSDCIWLVPGGE